MTQRTVQQLYFPCFLSKQLKYTCILLAFGLLAITGGFTQDRAAAKFIRENYSKSIAYIPMRDGVKLFTVIYQPKDSGVSYPFLLERTPYSSEPYEADEFPNSLGPNPSLMREKYIFVSQDVRGRYMSEGGFLEMTPHIAEKKTNKDVDESSDCFDTVEWLLKNIKNNNGKVGIYGISYPGFYASASLPDAHPAIKAVSPQAPVTDEFIGDDVNHKGAFFLLDNFGFMNYFDKPRNGPVKDYDGEMMELNHNNSYDFFMKMGTIKNSNKPEYFGNKGKIWNEYISHDTYDSYWKARNIRTHLKNVKPAVLVVGGWYDAEDLFGALETYRSIEKNSKGNNNNLVMGPWTHGAWASGFWNSYAGMDLGSNTSGYYQDSIETPFFNYYLKGKGSLSIAEATVFETGSNEWKKYAQWPPAESKPVAFYLRSGAKLSNDLPTSKEGYTMYISDPAHPVPYTGKKMRSRNNDYMGEDQNFLAERKDVVVFESAPLENDLTISGPIVANLFVSISTTDADFVVKLIDVESYEAQPNPVPVQRLVRAEVIRGKFRNDFSKPSPFTPNKIEQVKIELPDAAHIFKKGHKIMVQVQSSWFPLVDRNPQQFMTIPEANASDFKKATIKIHHQEGKASALILPVMQ
jgi:putative CocE/NonD family hydrolase